MKNGVQNWKNGRIFGRTKNEWNWKKLVKGFLDANWQDFIKYIDNQLFETQMSDPFADEVSDVYNGIMDKLSEPSKPAA